MPVAPEGEVIFPYKPKNTVEMWYYFPGERNLPIQTEKFAGEKWYAFPGLYNSINIQKELF